MNDIITCTNNLIIFDTIFIKFDVNADIITLNHSFGLTC